MKKLIFLLLAGLIIASCNTRLDEKKLRILTCGIRHESNTFSTLVTDIDVFNVLRGEEILQDKHLWSEYLKAENVEIYSARQSIAIRTADSSIVVGWNASQTDMLADDWYEVQ